MRLIGAEGEQVGILPTPKALQVAREANLDLVEVAPTAVPPVCRLLDYGKYKFELAKKEREARRGQKIAELREVRLRPRINEHDLEGKIRMVLKLLGKGDKVKVSIIFRGRENAHPERGRVILQKVLQGLKAQALVEKTPLLEGNNIVTVFSPLPVKKAKEEKVKEEAATSKGS